MPKTNVLLLKLLTVFLLSVASLTAAFSQENALGPVQLEKGYICGMEVGYNIRELLYDGADVKVERYMAEGDYYLIYHFNIKFCGIVSVSTDDDGVAIRISTRESLHNTEEGARVGMTLRELRDIYPDGLLVNALSLIHGTQDFYSFALPEEQGVFIIDVSSILEKCGDKFPICDEYIEDLKSTEYATF